MNPPFDKISVEDEFDDSGDEWVGHLPPFMTEDFERRNLDSTFAMNSDGSPNPDFPHPDEEFEELGNCQSCGPTNNLVFDGLCEDCAREIRPDNL